MVSNLPPEFDLAGDWGGMGGLESYWFPKSFEFALRAAKEALRDPSFEGCAVLSGECTRSPLRSAAAAESPRYCESNIVRRF